MKRQKVSTFHKSTRPVDKKIIVVNKTGIGGTAQVLTLFTAGSPCTLNGLGYSFDNVGTGAATMFWAILIQRDGDSLNTIGVSDGTSFYTPESDVLLNGVFPQNGASAPYMNITTHCKRKLMIGDKVVFAVRADGGTTGGIAGPITMFFKY